MKQVGEHIIQKTDRGLYVIARDVSFKESVSSVSIPAFIVEVGIAIKLVRLARILKKGET